MTKNSTWIFIIENSHLIVSYPKGGGTFIQQFRALWARRMSHLLKVDNRKCIFYDESNFSTANFNSSAAPSVQTPSARAKQVNLSTSPPSVAMLILRQ